MSPKQSEVFRESEGDAYQKRHQGSPPPVSPDVDRQTRAVVDLLDGIERSQRGAHPLPRATRLLEIGCGDGSRLAWLTTERKLTCAGIDPSSAAVAEAKARGADARVGTADTLPFDAGQFDIVLFGFCLYLCDPEDLFRIASEADRVLGDSGWVIISDFYSKSYQRVPYRHKEGLFTHKLDYRTMFDWHPHYTCFSHQVGDFAAFHLSDEQNEWVAVSVLRKNRSW